MDFTSWANSVLNCFKKIGRDINNINLQTWKVKGNTATDPDTDFIGTTDEKDLVFKTNSKKSAEISHLNGALLIGDYAFNSSDLNKGKKKAIIGGGVIIRTNENPNDDVFDIINDNENIGAGTDIFWLKLTKAQSKNVGLITLQDASNKGMSVRAGGKMVVGQMAATPNPTDTLQVDSGRVNDSGLTLTQLTSDSLSTEGAKPIGVTAAGKVVTVGSVVQQKFDHDSFDWQFHKDLIVSDFRVIKTGELVTIWGNFNISTTSETESIKLFSLPDVLMPDSDSGEYSQIIPVDRLGLPIGIIYTPRRLLFLGDGTVWLSNKPLHWNVGGDDMENTFDQSAFSITLTYSM